MFESGQELEVVIKNNEMKSNWSRYKYIYMIITSKCELGDCRGTVQGRTQDSPAIVQPATGAQSVIWMWMNAYRIFVKMTLNVRTQMVDFSALVNRDMKVHTTIDVRFDLYWTLVVSYFIYLDYNNCIRL